MSCTTAFRSPVVLGGVLTVPGMGLGCMGLTEFYGADTRRAEPDVVIGKAIDLGIPFLDTSDAYGPWRNEEAVGRALVGRRGRVVLATKFGVRRDAGQSDGVAGSICGEPAYVRSSCEASLRRLRTDHIDLYYMHRPDPGVPVEDTAGALAGLVEAGKVRAIGFCEIGPALLRRASSVHPVCALQSEFSLWHRDVAGMLAELSQGNVGFVAYSPLGRGFLSGAIRSLDELAPDDWRRASPRFQADNFARNLDVVDRLRSMASRYDMTAAQVALAWVKAQCPAAVPLTGATSAAQLEENVAALAIELTREQLAEIDGAAPAHAFQGEAWPAGSIGGRVDRVN